MKKKFKIGDCVKIANVDLGAEQKKKQYGKIVQYDKKQKKWVVFRLETQDRLLASEDMLTYMPTYALTNDFLKRILRYEINYADYLSKVIPGWNWTMQEDTYVYSLDDMIAMLENLQKEKPEQQAFSDWAYLIDFELDDCIEYPDDTKTDSTCLALGFSYPQNDAAMAKMIYDAVFRSTFENETSCALSDINISLIFVDIENYRQQKPIKPYLWSIGNKVKALVYAEDSKLKMLSDAEKSDLKTIIIELANRENDKALRTLGYCYYGGNALFPCDWPKARDCFLKLMTMDSVSDLEKCYYANTLGYIFYYGRCNEGTPEYEKAYRYYTLGAAGGIYESMYKLADMYAHGYYVPKNCRAAEALVRMVYDENLQRIKKEQFECQFADAALRMGNLCRDGVVKADEYYFYTLADFAIRKRLIYEHYGDKNVFDGIQRELAQIRETRPLKNDTAIVSSHVPAILGNLFDDGYSCLVTLTPLKKGIKVTVQRLAHQRQKLESVFECYPDYGYCNLTGKVSVTVYGLALPPLKKKVSFIADDLVALRTENKSTWCIFMHHDEKIIAFETNKVVRRLQGKAKKGLAEYQFASVSFSPGGKTYAYICELSDVGVGDRVVVMVNGEEKVVEIVRLFKMSIGDMPLAVNQYKKLLRKA